MYVPDQWYHATCNLDDFVLGVGGKGDSSHWPDHLHHIVTGNEEALRSLTSVDFAARTRDPQALGYIWGFQPSVLLLFCKPLLVLASAC